MDEPNATTCNIVAFSDMDEPNTTTCNIKAFSDMDKPNATRLVDLQTVFLTASRGLSNSSLDNSKENVDC
jgi:hypothetical protein